MIQSRRSPLHVNSEMHGLPWQQRAGGAALVSALLMSLGFVYWVHWGAKAWKRSVRRSPRRRWGEVEVGLRRWLQGHPRDGDAREMLGGLLYDQGRSEEALAVLGQVRETDRGWVNAQVVIGEIAIRRSQLGEAAQSFGVHRSATAPPSSPSSGWSPCSVSSGGRPRPAQVLRRLFQISHNPRHLADSILISGIETEFQDLGPEIEDYLKQTPDDPWLRRVWGLFLLSKGRSADALPHLEAAALAFDEDRVGRFALAESRMAVGIPVGDLSILGPAPSRAADAARWWVLRSRLAEVERGRGDETLECLKKAVSTGPLQCGGPLPPGSSPGPSRR